MVRCGFTTTPRAHTFQDRNKPHFVEVNPWSCISGRQFATLAVTPVQIRLWCSELHWHRKQSTVALSCLTSTKDDQTQIEDRPPVACLDPQTSPCPYIRTMSDVATSSRITITQAKAQAIEDNDAEKVGAFPTLQKFLLYQATDALCEQAANNISQKRRVYHQ